MKNQIRIKFYLIVIFTCSLLNVFAQSTGTTGFWDLRGNSGTDNSLNFFGTNDNHPVKFRAYGAQKMILTTNGRLGIGSNFSTPVFRLDVKGGSINTDSLYRISGVQVINRDASNRVQLGDATANIGIGIATPTQKLHVVGNIRSDGNIYVDGNAINSGNLTNSIQFGGPSGEGIASKRTPTGNQYGLDFYTGSLNRMAIMNGGNVGVGTTNAGSKFHVSGSEATSHGKNAAIEISNTSALGGNWYLRAGATGTSTPKKGFSIANDNGYYFVIDSLGQVAINTTTPANGYRLSVAGKMICEEIKVLLQANWPDYVFDDNYKLNSLEEVNNYIKANHHLQGLPAAGEVKDKGVNIGEMQSKMVEKMEELTLYIIQQQELLNQQKKDIENLKANNEVLNEWLNMNGNKNDRK